MKSYLPPGLPVPVADADGLAKPFWDGLAANEFRVQSCLACRVMQFGPEWLCHRCHSFDLEWIAIAPRGRIYSWERVWHPVHESLNTHGPYLVVLVEIPEAGNIRILGNLCGDPLQSVIIGSEVEGVFEHHPESSPPYSLLQWQTKQARVSRA
jgi:uncharacterized OB-fold protein